MSVKTRIGYNKDELAAWLPELLAEEPALITVHARTRKEMSLVPARWEHVREAVALRDASGVQTLIFGNGDCESLADAERRVEESGADGAMLGRAIFGNPWLFAEVVALSDSCRLCEKRNEMERRSNPGVSLDAKQGTCVHDKLRVLAEHCTLFDELCSHKNFAVMKKHFKAYVQGFPGAKELRERLMACDTADAVRAELEKYSTE